MRWWRSSAAGTIRKRPRRKDEAEKPTSLVIVHAPIVRCGREMICTTCHLRWGHLRCGQRLAIRSQGVLVSQISRIRSWDTQREDGRCSRHPALSTIKLWKGWGTLTSAAGQGRGPAASLIGMRYEQFVRAVALREVDVELSIERDDRRGNLIVTVDYIVSVGSHWRCEVCPVFCPG